MWCDGRRAVDLAPGARVEVRRGEHPIRLARLHQAPFTDRLVAKFDLPVSGWRGAAAKRRRAVGRSEHAMLEELRISGLGVIDDAVARARAGIHRRHRRDRRRQDDGRDGARAVARRSRGLRRRPPGRAAGQGRGPRTRRRRLAGWPQRAIDAGADLDDDAPHPGPHGLDRGALARRGRRLGRPGWRCCRSWPATSSSSTASPTSSSCCTRAGSASASTCSAAPKLLAARAAYQSDVHRGRRLRTRRSTRSPRSVASGPRRPTCCGSGWPRSTRSSPSQARMPSCWPRSRGSAHADALRAAADAGPAGAQW